MLGAEPAVMTLGKSVIAGQVLRPVEVPHPFAARFLAAIDAAPHAIDVKAVHRLRIDHGAGFKRHCFVRSPSP